MVAMYFVLVVLYFLFGYLFLPDEICATGFYFLGSLLFPLVVFIIVGVLIHKGIIKVPPASEPAPPKPEDETVELPPPAAAPIPPAPSTPHEILCSVDSMSGYDFERWCARLLRRMSFSSVEVTKASGDQGVDVLAEKGGVRYAIGGRSAGIVSVAQISAWIMRSSGQSNSSIAPRQAKESFP